MLVDDNGKEVEAGQAGEMYVRGPQVCLGYWRNPHETKETLDADGWLKTGDVAVVKDDWFWIVDRKKVRRRHRLNGKLLLTSMLGTNQGQCAASRSSGIRSSAP
jgi:acyl-CoA synthetase (AMP-forming)/AMP-acid ligase II